MKLAAAALALVLFVPGLAQSQAPAPPYLLDPGESPPSVPPPASTPGSYPSATAPLGHTHPECLATYGKTPAQIEATPCGMPGGIAQPNTTYKACNQSAGFDFGGSNITLDCVNFRSSSAFGFRCNPTSGSCDNITIRRTTAKGNNASGQSQNFIRFTTYNGHAMRSALVEKSDVSQSDVLLMGGSGLNSDSLRYPGESYALVIRGNRFHHITQYPGAHTDGIYLTEAAKGVLVENNLITAVGTNPAYNWGSMIQDQPTQAGAGNHVFRNNHIITDASGAALNFDGNPVCAAPVIWNNNKVDLKSPTLFSYTKANVASCASIGSRGGISSCTGNTFENGSPLKCSSNGL